MTLSAFSHAPASFQDPGFFQPAHMFSALEQKILPSLVSQVSPGRPLRFWVPNCGKGQTLYSLSMLMEELLPSLPVEILGSESDLLEVVQARYGLFYEEELENGLPRSNWRNYLHRLGSEWQLRAEVRDRCTVKLFDLAQGWPSLPQFDLIFLPKGLPDLPGPMQRHMLGALRDQLTPHGRLILDEARAGLEGLRLERFGDLLWLKRDISSDPRASLSALRPLDTQAMDS